jgi:hypothetical protein
MAWKRYLSAWSRHHRSGGFGIHSPYAYRFVRNVWRQPLPYYAYGDLGLLIGTIQDGTTRQQRREMDLIDEREARLLFRVTNFFNPQRILQLGLATGVESVAMLAVNRESRLHLYDPQLEQNALALRVLQSQQGRVEFYDDPLVAVDEVLETGAPSMMALLNRPVDEALLLRLLDARCVLVLRNMNRNKPVSALFDRCCDYMPMGQTYTNGKIAILNPNPKLQREDFMLWL